MAIRKYAKAMQTKECFLGFVCPYCGHINLKPASFTGKGVSNAYIVATEDKIITEANESATENAEFVYSSHRNRINKKRDFDGIGGTCDKCLKTTSWNTQDYYKRLRTAVSKFKGMMVVLLLIFSLVCMFKQAHSYVFQVLMAWTIFFILGILFISIRINHNHKTNITANGEGIEKNYKNINYPVVLDKTEIDDYLKWCTHGGKYTFADVSDTVPDPKKRNTELVKQYYLRCVLHMLLFGSLFMFFIKMDQGGWRAFEIESKLSAGIFLFSCVALRIQKSKIEFE